GIRDDLVTGVQTCALPIFDVATTQNAGQPQIHAEAPNNTVYQWHLGDKAKVDAAFAAAKHVTKIDLVNNRLIPNAIEPRAAIGRSEERRVGKGRRRRVLAT